MIDPRGVADKAVEVARSGVSFSSAQKLQREVSYPNETVLKYIVGFENFSPTSCCWFDVLVNVDDSGNVTRFIAIDPVGKEHAALSDDVVFPFFDRRDQRELYYRDFFYTALRM